MIKHCCVNNCIKKKKKTLISGYIIINANHSLVLTDKDHADLNFMGGEAEWHAYSG